jgi:hypothetical protein
MLPCQHTTKDKVLSALLPQLQGPTYSKANQLGSQQTAANTALGAQQQVIDHFVAVWTNTAASMK